MSASKKLILKNNEEDPENLSLSRKIKDQIDNYKEISKIQINQDIISKLLLLSKDAVIFGKNSEGILFGREEKDKLLITSIVPCTVSDSITENITDHYSNLNFDYTKIGYFFCDSQSEQFNQLKMKTFIEFQRIYPNAIFLFFDSSSINVNIYPFEILRISNDLMDKVLEEEIEENVRITKDTIREFYKNFLGKLNPNIKLFNKLNFKVISDTNTIFENLAENNNSNNNSNNCLYPIKKSSANMFCNSKIRKINFNCEKFINEQKKFINYYKNKKNRKINLGGHSNKDDIFKEDNNRDNNDNEDNKPDFADLRLISSNTNRLNNSLNNLIKTKAINLCINYNLKN